LVCVVLVVKRSHISLEVNGLATFRIRVVVELTAIYVALEHALDNAQKFPLAHSIAVRKDVAGPVNLYHERIIIMFRFALFLELVSEHTRFDIALGFFVLTIDALRSPCLVLQRASFIDVL